jgi:hypothetical protein
VFRVFAVCLPVPRAANAKPFSPVTPYTVTVVLGTNAKTIANAGGGD